MNECEEIDGYCSNGTCTNTIGGSKCECTTGFTISPSGDKCIGKPVISSFSEVISEEDIKKESDKKMFLFRYR